MKYVIFWICESILYCVILVILFITVPEAVAYRFVRQFTGVIPGDVWDKYYFLSLCVLSLLMVSLVIYIVARMKDMFF